MRVTDRNDNPNGTIQMQATVQLTAARVAGDRCQAVRAAIGDATRVQIDAKYAIPPLAQDFRHGPADMGQADDHDMIFRSFRFPLRNLSCRCWPFGQGLARCRPRTSMSGVSIMEIAVRAIAP